MIKINHQINEEGINNPVFFRNSNLFKLSSVDSGAINLSIAQPFELCPQRQKKKPKPLEPPSLSPIDQFSLQQTSPLGFASTFRGNLTLGGLMRLRRNVSHDRRYK